MSAPELPLIQPVSYDATCRLCGKKFTGPPLESPQDPRIQKMGEALFKHMLQGDEAHKTYAVICIAVCSFLIEDPIVKIFANGVRYAAFQALRKHYLPDEQLHSVVSGLPPEEFEAAMKDMRDFLTEQGEHAPKFPQMSSSANGKAV